MGMDDQVVLTSFVNEMDAQVLLMELQASGIEAEIRKDDCGGMRPFITAERGVEVLVFRQDLVKARELMGNATDDDVQVAPRTKSSGCLSLLIAVLISFAAGVFSVHLINYFKYGTEEFVAFTYFLDRNSDGEDDLEVQYDVRGVNIGGRADENFDGKWDSWWSNEFDVMKSARKDTDFNGVVDCAYTYEFGVVKQVDWTPNGQQCCRRELYENGVFQYERVDENKDGIFDVEIRYDPFLNVVDRKAL